MNTTKELIKPTSRLASVDMLRGVASLSVCLFHFASGNTLWLTDDFWIKRVFNYGHLGVEMFFIISGFVIPYSLFKSGYAYQDGGKFLLKRLIRIDPPYIAAIILIVCLSYISTLSPYYKGTGYQIDFGNLALHLGYINSFVNQPWLNPVFWTLALEFQFYIIMAILFPLMVYKQKFVNYLVVFLFLISHFIITNPSFIFFSSPFFVLGMLIFYLKNKQHNTSLILFFIVATLLLIYQQNSIASTFASIFTFVVIAYLKNWSNKWLLFIGTISYSLYLIHVPFGGRLINFFLNFVEGNYLRTVALFLILLVTIYASYIFYKFIELRAIMFSRKVFQNKPK
jgi:peptidoglycan/LPS O-acetylase OafA/YrhL